MSYPEVADTVDEWVEQNSLGPPLEYADQAFHQRNIVDAVDIPGGSVGPTLKRLEEYPCRAP